MGGRLLVLIIEHPPTIRSIRVWLFLALLCVHNRHCTVVVYSKPIVEQARRVCVYSDCIYACVYTGTQCGLG